MHSLSTYFTVLGVPFVLSMDVTVTFPVLIGVLVGWCNDVITLVVGLRSRSSYCNGDGVKTGHVFGDTHSNANSACADQSVEKGISF
jgi:hypothetical protein